MSEDYRIIGRPHGQPRSDGDVGVCVRVQLSGYPSRRWSQALGAGLTKELVGHPAVAHLRVNVNDIVQGDEIVLDGIEDRETSSLADALQHAVDGANRAVAEEVNGVPNVAQGEADAVADHIPLNESGNAASRDPLDARSCPSCGQAVPVTVGDQEAGDQLALGELDCPGCGVRLVRDVQGHADRGWRLAQ